MTAMWTGSGEEEEKGKYSAYHALCLETWRGGGRILSKVVGSSAAILTGLFQPNDDG